MVSCEYANDFTGNGLEGPFEVFVLGVGKVLNAVDEIGVDGFGVKAFVSRDYTFGKIPHEEDEGMRVCFYVIDNPLEAFLVPADIANMDITHQP